MRLIKNPKGDAVTRGYSMLSKENKTISENLQYGVDLESAGKNVQNIVLCREKETRTGIKQD